LKRFNYVPGLSLLQLPVDESGPGRHYVLPSGTLAPSVTTVLGHFKKAGLEKWKDRVGHDAAETIKNRAATKGTRLHALLEDYCQGIESSKTIMPNTLWSFKQVKQILDEDVDNIEYVEANLYSEKLRLAGRTDVIAEYKGQRSIIDFKTSTAIKKVEYITDYFEQGTAYSEMYSELTGNPCDQIVIIIANDYEPPQVFTAQPDQYRESLLGKLAEYRKYIDSEKNSVHK
jgi:PD-(D/E)XK nuclease superfamily